MPTKLNLETQTDSTEFSNKVAASIDNSGPAQTSIATFDKFDLNNGHDHDGINSKQIDWSNISSKPSAFVPAAHDHNSHTNIGPDDHHNHLSSGYDIIPNSVSVDDFINLNNSAKLKFDNNINIRYDSGTNTMFIESSASSNLTITNSISGTYIQSSSIYIGSTSSDIYFSTSNLHADNWEISGQGQAVFSSINNILISPESENNNISGVTRFNGVKLESSGQFSGLKVGNNLYQINHNSHAQNTDTGTNQTTFVINDSQQNNLKISTESISTINPSEAAITNDTLDDKALVIIGNAVRDGVHKKVKIYDDAEIQGNLLVQNIITARGNQEVATYHPDGTIKDNSSIGMIQIGYTLIQWGTSTGNGWRSINFQRAFANNTTPSVSCSAVDDSEAICKTRNISNNSFELNGIDNSFNNINCTLSWIAIGSV